MALTTPQEKKIAAREAEEAESGEKKRGRKPQSPEKAAEAAAEMKANVTDPESRVMKTRTGYIQGYNAQTVVTEEQIIVAAAVTQEENDVKQLQPMLEQTRENLAAVKVDEPIEAVAADAGYCSEENLQKDGENGTELFIATTKDWKQRKALREAPPPRGRIPGNLSARDRMERKLLTRRGRHLYKKRCRMVEPPYGQIKSVRGFGRFMRRGVQACRMEWNLICATHNLLKLWRSGKVCWC